jgi:TolB protein
VKADGTEPIKLRSVPWPQSFVGQQFSPDGTKLLMCHHVAGQPHLDVMNADGSGPIVVISLGCSDPQWSPNGTRILTTHGGNLYTVGPSGQNAVQLTTNGTPTESNHSARWSRQGSRIAYVRPTTLRDGTEYRAIYVMFAGGTGNKRVSPLGMNAASPSWGP